MIDNKTSRLQLPLPNVENYLEDDVARLSDALTTLDGVVATIAEDGKLVQDQVPEYVARLDTEGKLPSDNLPVSAVQTDGEGKIPEAVIPEAIARDAEVLSRNGNLSELADRAAAWLNVRPVGSTPLAGDPVGDYDAATKRWVQNLIGSGTVGPTMNGVMNYGVGDFHLRDSRAYIQPYEVLSDGQLLKRADWPELWAYAQMLSPITDAAWLADPQQRGKYSTGDGSTTFRVPDRNGVQTGSIKELFARGDGGVSANNGKIYEAAAPNIAGSAAGVSQGTYAQIFGTAVRGAFFTDNSLYPQGAGETIPSGTGATPGRLNTLNFDASYSNAVYGRYGVSDNILPRNFIGVWVIRASGGFVAAKTSWSVINGDAAIPAIGTTVLGGSVVSSYQVNGKDLVSAQLKAYHTVGGDWGWRLSGVNHSNSNETVLEYSGNGMLRTGRRPVGSSTTDAYNNTAIRVPHFWNDSAYGTYVPIIGGGAGLVSGAWRNFVTLGMMVGGSSASSHPHATIAQVYDYDLATGSGYGSGTRNTIFNGETYDIFFGDNSGTTNYVFSKSPVCDANKKRDIEPIDPTLALDNIGRMVYKSYIYLNDEKGQVRRGFIAQDLQEIDPQYIRSYKDSEGNTTLAIDENVLLLDTTAAVGLIAKMQEERDLEVAALKEEIQQLKELVNSMLQK